jgi:hypothetical protein
LPGGKNKWVSKRKEGTEWRRPQLPVEGSEPSAVAGAPTEAAPAVEEPSSEKKEEPQPVAPEAAAGGETPSGPPPPLAKGMMVEVQLRPDVWGSVAIKTMLGRRFQVLILSCVARPPSARLGPAGWPQNEVGDDGQRRHRVATQGSG